MKIQMNKLMLGALVVAGSVSLFSCSDEWDDHYSEVSSSAAGPSIWETLNSNPEYSAFANVLKENGYDAILSGGRTPRIYTVFAPTDEAMQSYTEGTNTVDEFIKNHVSYFYRNVNSREDTTVTMLNDKIMRLRGDLFGDKLNPAYTILDKNIACNNGLIQGLSGVVPYKKNIWEYIDTQNGELKKYLFNFNRTQLIVSESTEGYRDSSGNMVYLDSVTRLTNPLWYYVGHLNNEDSTYYSILLDDEAWEEGSERAAKSFNYYPSIQGTHFKEGADSLIRFKDALIKDVLTYNMTFRKMEFDAAMANSNLDVVPTTAGSYVPKAVVKKWMDQNEGLSTAKSASNGTAYLTSTYQYQPADAWQDTITVEGENPYRLFRVGSNQATSTPRLNTDTLTLSPLSTDYETSKKKYKVSNGSYMVVQQSAAQSASAFFGVANTQSGLYDLWVTFIPPFAAGVARPLPSEVNATVTYSYYGGSSITQRQLPSVTFNIDPFWVTRVKIAELDLGVCFLGFMNNNDFLFENQENPNNSDYLNKKYGLKLQLRNTAGVLDTTKDHNLYIDCIELVPRREN